MPHCRILRVCSALSLLAALLLSAAFLLAVTGCGASSGVGSSVSNIIGGFAFKGPVRNGTVSAYILGNDGMKGDFIASAATDERGAYKLQMTDYYGPVWLEVTGGIYVDEGTGIEREIPAENPLIAFIPLFDGRPPSQKGNASSGIGNKTFIAGIRALNTQICITPLTTIAASLASKRVADGADPESAAASANSQIADYFDLEDILHLGVADLSTDEGAGSDPDAQFAACIIGGMATQAAEYGVDPMEFIGAIANDASDGIFDGNDTEGPVKVGGRQISAEMTGPELAVYIEDFLESDRNQSDVTSSDMRGRIDGIGDKTGSVPVPNIDTISPSTGLSSGGTLITITGTNFVDGATVDFGGFSAINVNVASDTTITCNTPAYAAGTVNITVTNSLTQSGVLTNGFTYTSADPAIWYVDSDVALSGDGSSWDQAFKTIQEAVGPSGAASAGNEVWVAARTYANNGGGTATVLEMQEGIDIYGGFAGTETSRGERDWEINTTNLDGNGEAYHVVEGADNATLDGFNVTGGNANGSGTDCFGGGMFNSYSSPTVTNCVFSGNSAYMYGGGMYNSTSSPTVSTCNFVANLADRGGGMYNDNSSPTLSNCTFEGNSAESLGGGMCNLNSSPTVSNCTFTHNSVTTWSGFSVAGGGMYNRTSSPTVSNCTFTYNSVLYGTGGGMANGLSSPTVSNCIFMGNSAEYQGGGMANGLSSPTVSNCTFTGNTIGISGGGMSNRNESSPIVSNCIFWGDTAPNSPEIYSDGTSYCAVSYSDIGQIGGFSDGGGNINSDPIFDLSGGVSHLSVGSPCIDAANGDAAPETDIDGNARQNDPLTANTGTGTPDYVDMGACEFSISRVFWHVDAGVESSGDGTSWATAFKTIQQAIAGASAGEDIWVAAGIYTNNSMGQATVLVMKEGVDIYGGFDGTETNNGGDRDPETNTTTLDGKGWVSHVVEGADNAVLDGFRISGGNANGGGQSDHGGGMYNWRISSLRVSNCTFSGNTADNHGGGMYNYECCVTVSNCRFSGNAAVDNGGGMYNYECCVTVSNCKFSGNIAGDDGGGMYNAQSSPWVSNCTFNGNSAAQLDGNGGGMANHYDSFPTVKNCIYWDDTASSGPEIYNGYNSSCSVYYSDIKQAIVDGLYGFTDGGGNINSDPLFVDAYGADDTIGTDDDNLRLSAGSPCIDAADGDAAPETDIDGNARHDNPFTANSGTGTPDYVDMGAFEFGPAAIWYVDAGVVSSGDGTSWSDAFETIQEALAETSAAEDIWVAAGTYTNNVGGTATVLVMRTGVAIYGGFDGTETLRGERDWETNTTILDGNGEAYHVVEGAYNATLDGFTINGGNANGLAGNGFGGGMFNYDSSPTVSNCTFSGNAAGSSGGGMYNYIDSSPTVTNCIFSGNSAGYGGGMCNYQSSQTVTNCTFSGNTASYNGGGMVNADSSPTVINCIFNGNSAYDGYGGGMYNYDNSLPTVTNCTFSGNSTGYGGGMCNWGSLPMLTNCTFSGNLALNDGGGMFNRDNSSPLVMNCIFWGDTAPNGPEIYNDGTSSCTVTYSDVEGVYMGTGNIDADPHFVDADGADDTVGTADDNLRLSAGSPCIDAVDGDAAPETDIEGSARYDDPATVDTGAGTPDYVDIGAYEYQGE